MSQITTAEHGMPATAAADTLPTSGRRHPRVPTGLALYLTVLGLVSGLLMTSQAWLRAEEPTDDAGESTEKAFMIILGITLGVAVTAAAVIYLKTKTDLFKG